MPKGRPFVFIAVLLDWSKFVYYLVLDGFPKASFPLHGRNAIHRNLFYAAVIQRSPSRKKYVRAVVRTTAIIHSRAHDAVKTQRADLQPACRRKVLVRVFLPANQDSNGSREPVSLRFPRPPCGA